MRPRLAHHQPVDEHHTKAVVGFARVNAGFTLIEMMVALAIISVMFGAAVMGVGALTGAQAKQAATTLAGAVRVLFDSSALSGHTCRLVFELAENDETGTKFHAECAQGAIAVQSNRDEELRATKEAQEEKSEPDRGSFDRSPTLEDLMAQEKQRIAQQRTFGEFTSDEIPTQTIPTSVKVSVWTRSQKKYVTEGPAYLYFFPQGYTEKAHIRLQQGDNAWTLVVEPLTGKVRVVGEALEVPRS